MIFSWFGAVALAGTVFSTTLAGDLYEVDTRTLASVFRVGGLGVGGLSGAAYDPVLNEVWAIAESYPVDALFKVGVAGWTVQYMGGPGAFQHGLAFDPIGRSLVTVGVLGVLSVAPFSRASYLSRSGFDTSNADWFDDGGFVVSQDRVTGTFYGIAPPVAPWPLTAVRPFGPYNISGLAYDKDTKTFWQFTVGGVDVLEPETFTPIAVMNAASDYDGAAGSIDNVPNQTPALIISSMACPAAGPAYVTVVDAMPGGHVQFGSSLQAGNHRIRGGACAGTTLGLTSPTPRYDLVANSYGIASTVVNFTAAACGNLKIQAVDMDTCLATSVQPVDYVTLP